MLHAEAHTGNGVRYDARLLGQLIESCLHCVHRHGATVALRSSVYDGIRAALDLMHVLQLVLGLKVHVGNVFNLRLRPCLGVVEANLARNTQTIKSTRHQSRSGVSRSLLK